MSPTHTSRGLPGWLILMGALTAIGPFAIDMYLPAFPTIAANLGVPRGDVERTLAAYLIGLALAQVFYGPMADRYGRKPPLLVGLALFMLGSLGCALAGSAQALTGWRVLQAMGGAAGIVIPRAVIRDHYETQEAARAMSLLMLIMGLAPILAPLAGGQLLTIASWRSLFWVMVAGGAMLMTAVILIMKESLAPERVCRCAGRPSCTITAPCSPIAASWRTAAGGFGRRHVRVHHRFAARVHRTLRRAAAVFRPAVRRQRAVADRVLADQRAPAAYPSAAPVAAPRADRAGLRQPAAVALTVAGWMSLPLLMLCLIGYMGSQGFVNPNSAALALAEQSAWAPPRPCWGRFNCPAARWPDSPSAPADRQRPALTTTLATCACLSWISGRVAQSHTR